MLQPTEISAPPDTGTGLPGRWTLPPWWPWGAGLLVGLVVLGPGLGGGSLLSLDLLVTPDIPVPNGVFGLGPALSQRVPMFVPIGLGSTVLGGPVTIKVLLVASVASGFAGAARLARVMAPAGLGIGVVGQAAAGLLWAAGPFALTRMGAGHVNLWWAIAVLPWALPRLCRPAAHLPSTWLASMAMAVGGPGGGTLGLAVGAIALVVQVPPRRWGRAGAALVLPHLVWILPTVVLLWAGAGVTGAGGFATHADGIAGWPAILAGNGFWRWDVQVGASGALGAVVGAVVAGLACVGAIATVRGRDRRAWQVAAVVVGAVGLLLAFASAVPGVRDGYGWLSDLPVGAPLRESHRFLALWLLVAAPLAAVGAASLPRRWRRDLASPVLLVAVAAISVPGWWGLGGRLVPVDYPPGWGVVRQHLAQHPGTAVAFPWSEYPPLSFADGRQVFNPVPEYLGGDVVSSYDPVFDPEVPSQEQVDRRSDVVDRLSDDALAGRPIARGLAEVGVRWVVVVHESGWERYASLATDPGLRVVLALDDVDLYEVIAWPGPVVGPDGAAHDLSRPVPPLLRTSAPAGSTLNVAGAPGWVRGWGAPVEVTDDGRLRTTSGSGPIWFWPAAVLVLAYAGLAIVTVVACRSHGCDLCRLLVSQGRRG